ncbi:FAD-dependent oxidoreductase [Candidatus Latescibacterota bacterium]
MSDKSIQAWRCKVCGYIHRGPEPPDWCPVCGAARELFEPYEEHVQKEPQVVAKGWKCLNCSYIHSGVTHPGECPVCAAQPDRFERVIESGETGISSQAPSKVVIAGAGIAGVSAAEAIREVSADTEIVLLSKEADLPYYRLNLTRLLAGELTENELPIHPADWYEERGIRLQTETEVIDISSDGKYVTLQGGAEETYDKLILTIGSHPYIPPLPGAVRDGVMSLRTLDNARKILDEIKPGIKIICIGGGILGLETAGALSRQGAEVTLLEGFDYPMPRQLNKSAGLILAEFIEKEGITLHTMARVEEILGDERVRAVKLRDNSVLDADLVIITTGVRPNSYLARNSGLEVNQGIIVDDYMTTSHPDILAAGDLAEHRGEVYGIWSPSMFQGSIAGMNAAGKRMEFGGVPRSNILKVLGIDMFSIGRIQPSDASSEVFENTRDGSYFGFLFDDSYLAGAILLGDTSLSSPVKQAIETRYDFSGLLGKRPVVDALLDHFNDLE